MSDNRTNEPTEAMIEAAAKALYEFETGLAEDSWGRAFEVERSLWRDEARAALAAAQGAAPQAEGAPKSSYISPSLPGMIRNLWKSDPSENSVRTALKLAGDLIQELIDLKASPVLPSSGVDEVALAEVIEMHREVYLPKQGDSGCSCGWRRTIGDNDFSAHRARAVAERLKGQGR